MELTIPAPSKAENSNPHALVHFSQDGSTNVHTFKHGPHDPVFVTCWNFLYGNGYFERHQVNANPPLGSNCRHDGCL